MKRGTRKTSTLKTNAAPPAANAAPSPYAQLSPNPLLPNPLSPAIHDGPPATDLAPHFAEPPELPYVQAGLEPEPPQAVADYRAVAAPIGTAAPKTPPPVPIEQMSLIQLRGYIQRSGIADAYPDLMDVYDIAKLRGIVAELVGN